MNIETIFFDLIIFFFLGAVGYALYLWYPQIWRKEKTGWWVALVVLLSLAWLVIFYGSFIEPQIITSSHHTVHLGKSGTYVRLAVLSDHHLGPYKSERFMERLLKRVQLENPDMVLFLGDYIHQKPEAISGLKPFAKLYNRSSKYLGSYGVLGNHDYGIKEGRDGELYGAVDEGVLATVKEGVRQAQIALLNNDRLPFWIGNQRFYLIGIEDIWTGRDNYGTNVLHDLPPNIPKILLSHNPDVAFYSKHMADLIIAGHTHGGQIRLPWLGPVANIQSNIPREFAKGLHIVNDNLVFTTSGVGESGPRARLFNPPEVAILNIEL